MNSPIPCFRDSDDNRFPPEIEEEESPLTLVEQGIEWLCDEWKEAQQFDSYEAWHDVRMMLYGAKQALNHCAHKHDDRQAIDLFSSIAFQNSRDCLNEGRIAS